MADTWPFTPSSASIFPHAPKWHLHREASRHLHTHLVHSGCRKSPSHSWSNAPNRSNQQQWTRVTEQILSLAIYRNVPDSGRIIPAHYLPLKSHQPATIRSGKVWSLWDDLSCGTVEFPQQFLSWTPTTHECQRGTLTHTTHTLWPGESEGTARVTSHKHQTVRRNNSRREVLW